MCIELLKFADAAWSGRGNSNLKTGSSHYLQSPHQQYVYQNLNSQQCWHFQCSPCSPCSLFCFCFSVSPMIRILSIWIEWTVFSICFTFSISKWKEKDVEILIYLANHCGANSIHEWTHLWLVYDRNSCCWLCWRGRRKEEFHILCIMRYELFSLFWSKL